MGSERNRQARRIFEQVVEVPGAQLAHLLDEACGDDEALRAAVERLLHADAAAGSFLEEPLVRATPANGISATSKPVETATPPGRIGPYEVLEKIGEGGMGTVYRAMRDDEAFQREVAVKLIDHSKMDKEARRRLRFERQILAALDHPWIAQIFDGGTTDQGVPYLVMEYVDGEPIDRYCEHEELSIRQRIELFRKICAAVHCSHQNLVVHCDLKPSNILITAAGEPKLLDFGIAKLLRRGETGDRDEPTTLGSRPLTPEYASPEQLRGETLSTVSDVYSLGILLTKLLTGQRPEASKRLTRETFGNGEIVLPSSTARHASPDLSSRLRGDLDAIVLKALRPKPEERYGSAEQFSEDLGRHLDGFPVLAHRGSLRYRARKFLRRHRTPVAAAAAGFVLLSVFSLSMATLAGRLSQERAKLQEVVGFFRLFFQRAGPLVDQGRSLTLREAVDQNAEMIEEGLEDQPAVKVEIASVLGDIYRDLGQPEQALEWSNRALALNRRLAGEDSQAYALSLVQVGAARRELGQYDEAEAETRSGLRWLRAHSDTEPAKLVESLNNLVSLFCYQGRYEEVDDESVAALRLAEEQLDETAIETLVATANRGLVLRGLGHSERAQHSYERAFDLYQQTFGPTHPHVATLLLNLSLIQRDHGDLGLAQSTLEAANSQFLEIFGRNHYARVRPLLGLAKLASQQQHIDEALIFYREAIDVAKASEAEPAFVLRPSVGLGELALASGRCQEGEPTLRGALQHSRAHAGSRWRYAEIEGLLGECLTQRGAHDEARSFLTTSFERLQAHDNIDPETLNRALGRLVTFYDAVGEEPARQRAAAEMAEIETEPSS